MVAALCYAVPTSVWAEPKPPEEASDTVEEVGKAVEGVRQVLGTISSHADRLGYGGLSRDAERLNRALATGQEYAELAAMLASANIPTGWSWELMTHAGVGAEELGEQSSTGELAIAAGLVVSGPTCKLVDVGAQLAFSKPRGPSATQFAHACLGGYFDPETSTEIFRLSGFESASLNVRPAVAALAVVGSGGYSSFEAGMDAEGVRWHYNNGTRSLALLRIRIAEGWLLQSIGSDSRSILTLDVDSWMVEWRVHRGPGALADMTLQFMEIDVKTVQSGESAGAIRIAPFSIAGVGSRNVNFDLSGAVEATAREVDDEGQPVSDSEPPHVGAFTWRAALRGGVPWLYAGISHDIRLVPTLTADLVVEERTSIFGYFDRGPFFLDAKGFIAKNDLYLDSNDSRDGQTDTWGIDALLAVRVNETMSVGAWVEAGRSFYFAEAGDNLNALPDPARGWRMMATFSYGIGRSSRF